MQCVNQNGGYRCMPRSLYNQPYRSIDLPVAPDPVYQDSQGGLLDTFLPARPRSADPSYPIMRTTARCYLGYTLAEDGTCNGESTNNPHSRSIQIIFLKTRQEHSNVFTILFRSKSFFCLFVKGRLTYFFNVFQTPKVTVYKGLYVVLL